MRRGTKTLREFRVRWQGYAAAEDTWEPEANLPDAIVSQYLEARRITDMGGASDVGAARRVASKAAASCGAGRKRKDSG